MLLLGFFKYCLCYSPCIKDCISRKSISIKTCIFFLSYMNCIQFAQLISFLKCGLLEQLTTSNFSLILPKETTTLTLLTGICTVSYPLNVKWIPLKVTVYCLIVFFLETVAEEAQKKKSNNNNKNYQLVHQLMLTEKKISRLVFVINTMNRSIKILRYRITKNKTAVIIII